MLGAGLSSGLCTWTGVWGGGLSEATCVPRQVWLLTPPPHVDGLIIDRYSGRSKQEACAIVSK